MNAILQAFGRLVCGITKTHKWGRSKDYPVLSEDRVTLSYYERGKHCERCGEYALVKRRKGKA